MPNRTAESSRTSLQAPLRAFVAMAIGRDETDQVYDQMIRPALAAAGITAVRVDRIEHNEDIDDRIIAELQQCDLLVADLTFARPSVYFEAGYTQPRAPVIYTCRRDHLSPRPDDPFGNYRVHFDLQMKNIIPWSGPDDARFVAALTRRARLVVAPLVRQRDQVQQDFRAARRFEGLSVRKRIANLIEHGAALLEASGFSVFELGEQAAIGNSSALGVVFKADEGAVGEDPLEPGKLARRWDKGHLVHAILHVGPSLERNVLERVTDLVTANRFYSVGPAGAIHRVPKQLTDVFLLCALQKASVAQIAVSLPRFHRKAEDTYVLRVRQPWPRRLARGYARVLPAQPPAYSRMRTFRGWIPSKGHEHPRDLEVRKGRLLYGDQPVAEIAVVARTIRVHAITGLPSAERFAAALADAIQDVAK